MSDARARVLLTPGDLAGRLGSPNLVLIEIRDERAAAPAGRALIPGSQCGYLDTDFSGPPTKTGGRRPLPAIAAFQAKARGWGVNPDSLVVVYDDNSGAQAARAWWTFRWAGFDNVRLLDGGLKGWAAHSGATTTNEAPAAKPGTVNLRPGCMPTIEADEAAALASAGRLFDARGRAAYVGEAGKPATGHIPGAICAPSGEHTEASGHFRQADSIRERFAALGLTSSGDKAGVYCGSGNAAAHLLAAMHAAGMEAALYVGSWSAWSADPARPVATGPNP